MDTELMLDVGQANEFKLAARRAGYTNADIKRMCEGDTLTRLLPVLRGVGEVQIVKHLIDFGAAPFVPEGWTVESHQMQDKQFEWDPVKVRLHLDESQKSGEVIEGNKLRKRLANKGIFNANLLDYLLANLRLIPEAWKGQCIFFWGTIYRDDYGNLRVRYLRWDGGRWRWDCSWLGYDWGSSYPAAVLAN